MFSEPKLSRGYKKRKRSRFPGNKLPFCESDEDLDSNSEIVQDLSAVDPEQDQPESPIYSVNDNHTAEDSDFDAITERQRVHSFNSSDNSELSAAELSDDDETHQERTNKRSKQHELSLLIACVFHSCGLNDQVRKKIYKMMQLISESDCKLLPFSKFINLVTAIKRIPTSSYTYCRTHNTVSNPRTCQCNKNTGELEVFDTKKTIKTIISKNREYLFQNYDLDRTFDSGICSKPIYKKLWSDSLSTNIIRISLICNIDDAQMMKTSRTCCTPVSCLIAELPRHRRINKGNVFNLGVYWGVNGIPIEFLIDEFINRQFIENFRIFDDTCSQYHDLCQLKFAIDHNDATQIVVVRFLAIICDSVEKYKVLNCKMFNGYYGCPYCLIKGSSVEVPGSESRKFVYPYDADVGQPKKTCQIYKDHAEIATSTRSCSLGIKGPTSLAKIVMIPIGVPIDYMHCVLEGVFKFLITLKPFSRDSCKAALDSYVARTCIPHDFSRKFRKFTEIAYWRANEARTFLVYLVTYLKRLVSSDSFMIIFGLSIAVRLLCSEDLDDADQANVILKKVLASVQDIYGESNMRFNLHLLTHLSEQYQNFGSLVDLSTFSFENNIFNLKRSFHGTRGQLRQMKDSYLFSKGLQTFENDLEVARKDLDPKGYLDFLSLSQISSLPTVLGNEDVNFQINSQMLNRLRSHYPEVEHSDLKFYHQFKQAHKIFHSLNYKYKRGSCSYIASYSINNENKKFGKIICFLAIKSRLDPSNILKTFVIVEKYQKLASVNILSGLEPMTNHHLKDLARMSVMKKYHHVVNETDSQDLVCTEMLNERMIALKDERYAARFVLTECDLPIEHD